MRSATRSGSPTTCPAPPITVTRRSGTPSPGCCTGPSDCGVAAIAIEDLDFTAEKTREKHGGKKRFRQLISGMPTGKLGPGSSRWPPSTDSRSSPSTRPTPRMWGAQHWQKPLAPATPQDDPSRRRWHRDRATRPRAPDPATDGTAPTRPERSSRASDRPGRTGRTRA